MTHLTAREIEEMAPDERLRRLAEVKEEMLQLRAQRSMGGSSSDYGSYKRTRRTIARLLTAINRDGGA